MISYDLCFGIMFGLLLGYFMGMFLVYHSWLKERKEKINELDFEIMTLNHARFNIMQNEIKEMMKNGNNRKKRR